MNVSGGLKSKGHPLGATGVGQACEIFHQLRGTAQLPARQVKGATTALTHNVGGSGMHQRRDASRSVSVSARRRSPEALLSPTRAMPGRLLLGLAAVLDEARPGEKSGGGRADVGPIDRTTSRGSLQAYLRGGGCNPVRLQIPTGGSLDADGNELA